MVDRGGIRRAVVGVVVVMGRQHLGVGVHVRGVVVVVGLVLGLGPGRCVAGGGVVDWLGDLGCFDRAASGVPCG